MNINPDALAFIIGLFMPLVISLLKRPEWPNWAKLTAAGVVCLAVGTVSTLVSSQVDLRADPEAILVAAAACFTSATLIYKAWFGATPLNGGLTDWPGP